MLRTAWLLVALLAIVPQAEGGQVYVIDLDKDDPQQLTTDDSLACGSPVWSHDGKRIAFDAWPADETLQSSAIHVIDAEGGPVTRLGHGSVASWSPDDRLLLYHTYVPDQSVWVMAADGAGAEEVLKGAYSPRWMADNLSFAVLTHQGLVKFDLTAGKMTLIASIPSPQPGFSYSPATDRFLVVNRRTWTLYVVERQEGGELWSARQRWRNPRVQTRGWMSNEGRIGQISWAPDGKRAVVAIGDVQSDCRLYLINSDDKEEPDPLPGVPDDWISCNPNWSPDGKCIAFVRLEPTQPE